MVSNTKLIIEVAGRIHHSGKVTTKMQPQVTMHSRCNRGAVTIFGETYPLNTEWAINNWI